MAVCCEVEGWVNRGFRGEYVWAWPYRRGKVEKLKNYNGLNIFVNIFFIVLHETQGKFPEKYCEETQTFKSWNSTPPSPPTCHANWGKYLTIPLVNSFVKSIRKRNV